MRSSPVLVALTLALGAAPAFAQSPPDPAPRLAQQTAAMGRLAWMDGQWRGQAWTYVASGEKQQITQTERIGPMLGGSIKVLEGHGYNPDGSTGFNAFATVAFEPETGKYTLHSNAMSQVGDFLLTPTADGYVWEIPAGPMTIRYTATFKDGAWREIGERVMTARPPMLFFEMNLKRIGDTGWPAAGPVPPN